MSEVKVESSAGPKGKVDIILGRIGSGDGGIKLTGLKCDLDSIICVETKKVGKMGDIEVLRQGMIEAIAISSCYDNLRGPTILLICKFACMGGRNPDMEICFSFFIKRVWLWHA